MRLLLAAFILHLSAFILSAQTVGQFELRKRTSGGYTSYGITPENGKAIGFTAGVPAMITVGGSGSGTGDALIGDPLSQFAATTSQQLRGVLSDESGSGLFLTTTGSGASLTGITAGQISGLGTLATQSATITDYLTTAAAASAYQPLDSDLTAIAALVTTTAGRDLLDDANAAAQRTTLGLGTLATQSGTFSGTSSGTNTGDQDLSGYLTSATAATTYAPLTAPTFSGTVTGGMIVADDANTTAHADFIAGGITFYQSDGFTGSFAFDVMTASRTWNMPNASGTFLLTNGSGASLTALNGSNISSGTVAAARLGSGSAITTKYLRGDNTWQTISGGGDALTSSTLAQFAATTSTQLRSVISDESGTGDILTTNGSGASLTGITSGQISGLGTLATQSATITDYLTSAAAAAAYQPLDSDLTSIAALITTTAGRALLDDADASAQRTTLGLGTLATQSATITDYITTAAAAAAYQPLDSDLTSIAALITTAAGRALLDDADASAQRTTLGLGTLATQSATITDYITSAAAAAAYQPLDSDLTSIAALITTTAGRALLDDADASAQRTTLGLGTLATQSATITDYLTTATAASTYLTPAGNGSGLTSLNASNISSGTVAAARLGSGTSITTKYLRGDNTWQTVSAGGAAPQPVQAVLTTTATTTSTTYADITGLTVSYTPSSTTQKVLVRGSVSIGSTSSNQTALRLARDGTALTVATASGSRTVSHVSFYDVNNGLGMETATFEFLDTPGTTSAVTYSIQWKRGGSSGTSYLNRAQDDLDYDSRANTVSTLTIIPFAE